MGASRHVFWPCLVPLTSSLCWASALRRAGSYGHHTRTDDMHPRSHGHFGLTFSS